jgi:hypothetical protein
MDIGRAVAVVELGDWVVAVNLQERRKRGKQ